MKRILATAAALLTLTACGVLTLTACGVELDAAEHHSARTFAHTGGTLTIRATAGGLTLTPGAGLGVTVDRWLRGKAATESAWKLANGTLTLTADCTMIFGDCGARYAVRVPPGVKLVVEGGDDPVTLSGLAQDVDLATTGGRIKAQGLTGALRLRSDDGSIVADRLGSARVRAQTRDGEIRLTFATPPTRVDARSYHGRVTTTVPHGVYGITVDSREGPERSDIRDAGPGSARTIVARSTEGAVRVKERSG